MSASIDPVILALANAMIGAAGSKLRVRFYTDPGPHQVGDAVESFTPLPTPCYDPDANPPSWTLRQETDGIQAVTAEAQPVYPRYNSDVGPAFSNGAFVTLAGVGGALQVIGVQSFDPPIVFRAGEPPVPVQARVRMAISPGTDSGSGTVVVAGDAGVARLSRQSARHLWQGLPRDRLLYLRDLLLSLGKGDAKAQDHDEALGRATRSFNDLPATDAAISTILSRCQECLDATR